MKAKVVKVFEEFPHVFEVGDVIEVEEIEPSWISEKRRFKVQIDEKHSERFFEDQLEFQE